MICTVGTYQSKQKYMAEWILQHCRGALLLLFTLILPMSSAKRRHLKINCHMYRGIFARTRLCLLLAACKTNSLMKKPSKQVVSCENTHFGCPSTTRGKPAHKAFFDLKWGLHKYVRDALSAMSFRFTGPDPYGADKMSSTTTQVWLLQVKTLSDAETYSITCASLTPGITSEDTKLESINSQSTVSVHHCSALPLTFPNPSRQTADVDWWLSVAKSTPRGTARSPLPRQSCLKVGLPPPPPQPTTLANTLHRHQFRSVFSSHPLYTEPTTSEDGDIIYLIKSQHFNLQTHIHLPFSACVKLPCPSLLPYCPSLCWAQKSEGGRNRAGE